MSTFGSIKSHCTRTALFMGALILLTIPMQVFASTWDEPWHRDVVAKADSFGRYELISATPTRAVFKEILHLAGAQTGANVEIDGFYGTLTSQTTIVGPGGRVVDDEWSLTFRNPGTQYYLFLQKAPSGNTWRIATPTSGFAPVRDEKVTATFRISVHLALVDARTFEMTQACIFDKLHGKSECSPNVSAFINQQLSLPPAEVSAAAPPAQMDRFFNQHVALETAYLTRYSLSRETLVKFLSDSSFHTQISAVRALAASTVADRNAMLMNFVTDDTRDALARVVAVAMIRETNGRELKDQLAAYAPKASVQEVGLVSNIMDPRVGTRFPENLKKAIEELLTSWK